MKVDASKRSASSTFEGSGLVDNFIERTQSTGAVKRQKKDIEQLRAEVAAARKLVESSTREAKEERRKTEERQVSWDTGNVLQDPVVRC